MKQEEIINQIEDLLQELKASLNIKKSSSLDLTRRGPKSEAKFIGLTADVHALINDGFFDKHKTLAQIQHRLREEGVSKPTTALMNPILRLIREKHLGRTKPDKGQYQYFKR